jgi:antitoxin (DNA-binding transcriptional repressor) of toxin-antitoxin stability system
MSVVRLPELGEQAASLVRRVRDTGEVVDIEEHGVVVARVVPVPGSTPEQADLESFWDDLDDIAAEINASWPKGVSAEDAINDVRREL